jgi:hypothetical protein
LDAQPPLSPELSAKVAQLFGDQAAVVSQLLLDRCGANLPRIAKQGEAGIERVRCAVLKLSEADIGKLEQAIDRANIDWRDVLVWSGFSAGDTHKAWLETA